MYMCTKLSLLLAHLFVEMCVERWPHMFLLLTLLCSLLRYIGTRPVRLFRVMMNKSESVLAVSSRSWLSYIHQSRLHLTPLSYEVLDYVSSFSSEQCPEGIVAIAANTLRILSLEKLGIIFNQVATPLQYTPCLLYTSPSPRDATLSRMPSSA